MATTAESSEEGHYQMLRSLRWPSGVTCPHGSHRHVTTHSRFARTPRRRYLCLDCRRTFSDLTGTPFAGTNLPLATWFRCLALLGSGLRTSALAQALGVKWDTTARMQRRLVVALARPGLVRDLREAIHRGAARLSDRPERASPGPV